jgi:hypothetical protein
MAPVARKLQIGFESFKIINQPKKDVNLRFSSSNMQRLAALLDTTEQEEFLLLWKPKTNRGAGPRFMLGRGGSGLPRCETLNCCQQSETGTCHHCDTQ